MRMDPSFPENWMEYPARQAELVLYRQLSHGVAPGWALYEIRARQECCELDFLLYLVGVPPGRHGGQGRRLPSAGR